MWSRNLLMSLWLLAVSTSTFAGGYTSLSTSSGPNEYRSYSFKGNVDLLESLKLNIDSLLSASTSSAYLHQSGAGMTWEASELVRANYRYSITDDDTLLAEGNEGNLSLSLDTLWEGELFTVVDLGYADFKYQSSKPNVAGRTLVQSRISYGISQDLTPDFSVYAYHDRFLYDRNVVPLALQIIIRSRNTADAAYTLLAFPDFTNTLGFSWSVTDNINFNLSGSRTITQIQQELRNRTISFKYKFSKTFSMGISASRATSTELRGPLGGLLQAESDDSYFGINANVKF